MMGILREGKSVRHWFGNHAEVYATITEKTKGFAELPELKPIFQRENKNPGH